MKPTSPCLGCTKRNEYCHIQGNCRDYDDFKIAYNDYINQIKIAKDTDVAYSSYVSMCKTSMISYRRNHRRVGGKSN